MMSKIKKSNKHKDPIWIHLVLIISVILVCFPLVFTLIKSTQSINPSYNPFTINWLFIFLVT